MVSVPTFDDAVEYLRGASPSELPGSRPRSSVRRLSICSIAPSPCPCTSRSSSSVSSSRPGQHSLCASRPSFVPGDPGRRRLVAFGFAALAIAHVLHGGAFMPADGEDVVTLIRAMGYALMLVGLAGPTGSEPVAASVGAALTVRIRFRSCPPHWPFSPRRQRSRARSEEDPRPTAASRWACSSSPLSEVFVSVAPQLRVRRRRGQQLPADRARLQTLGYVAIGTWLWSSVRESIRTRFVASFVALLVDRGPRLGDDIDRSDLQPGRRRGTEARRHPTGRRLGALEGRPGTLIRGAQELAVDATASRTRSPEFLQAVGTRLSQENVDRRSTEPTSSSSIRRVRRSHRLGRIR